jgi:hypothetical protein
MNAAVDPNSVASFAADKYIEGITAIADARGHDLCIVEQDEREFIQQAVLTGLRHMIYLAEAK